MKAAPPPARLAERFQVACITAEETTRESASSVTARLRSTRPGARNAGHDEWRASSLLCRQVCDPRVREPWRRSVQSSAALILPYPEAGGERKPRRNHKLGPAYHASQAEQAPLPRPLPRRGQ